MKRNNESKELTKINREQDACGLVLHQQHLPLELLGFIRGKAHVILYMYNFTDPKDSYTKISEKLR